MGRPYLIPGNITDSPVGRHEKKIAYTLWYRQSPMIANLHVIMVAQTTKYRHSIIFAKVCIMLANIHIVVIISIKSYFFSLIFIYRQILPKLFQ